MLLLVQHIAPYRLQMRSADGEGSVSLLPREACPAQFPPDPSRGFAFQFPHHIRQPMRRTQPRKNMDMVAGASDGMGDSVHAANRAAEVFVDATTSLESQPRFPMFRGENEMVMEGQMRRGHARASRAHSGAQPDFFGRVRRFRSAPPPANLSAPSGNARQTANPFSSHLPNGSFAGCASIKRRAPEGRKPLAGGETTGNHRSIWIGAPAEREKRANHH